MIAKFEKSELSVRLADKMDRMDRTWRWFTNLLFRMFFRKVIDLFGFWNDFNETYPDSMGEYQLGEEIEGRDVVYNWYRHKDREDRFLMYNNLGNIDY